MTAFFANCIYINPHTETESYHVDKILFPMQPATKISSNDDITVSDSNATNETKFKVIGIFWAIIPLWNTEQA